MRTLGQPTGSGAASAAADPRNLVDILKDVKAHFVEFPDHGMNCSDMDKHIREIAVQIDAYDDPRSIVAEQQSPAGKARSAMRYILNAALRKI